MVGKTLLAWVTYAAVVLLSITVLTQDQDVIQYHELDQDGALVLRERLNMPMRAAAVEPTPWRYRFLAQPDSDSRYVLGVLDADTLDLRVDLGFRQYTRQRFRLLGVDAPEIRGPEKAEGERYKKMVFKWISEANVNGGCCRITSAITGPPPVI